MFPVSSGQPLIWGVTVSLFMTGALAVRRLSPALALGIAWAGAIMQMGLGLNPMPSNIAIFAVLYVTAAYGRRWLFWAGFASAVLGALVITLYLVLATTFVQGGLSLATVSVAAVTLVAATFALLLAWTAGALVRASTRARENRAAQERAEAEAVAEQERVRIARDMHDVVAHSLAVVIAQADGARYAAASSPAHDGSAPDEVAVHALATISTTARAALADVRLLLTQLRHSQADGPQPTLADLEDLYAQVRAAGVAVTVDIDPMPRAEVPAGVQLAVYRILQEALTNALRHGDARAVAVTQAWHPDRVELGVRNRVPDGAVPHRSGHGLIGMAERASLVGGTLRAGVESGEFAVHAALPIGAGR
ncbi:sensor histidine kinase [Microbacterium rhizomatis]|uniref:histidine kinase n=2 Tax=Microbacterium rhizomatis TaxID=1631477 RepID=A0A5J5J3P7_9MICO|nr:sensor histidine kinase [Microbacterium rhizomatis]